MLKFCLPWQSSLQDLKKSVIIMCFSCTSGEPTAFWKPPKAQGALYSFFGIFWEPCTLQLFTVDVYSFCLLVKLECTRKKYFLQNNHYEYKDWKGTRVYYRGIEGYCMGRGTLQERGIEGHCRGRGTLYVLIYQTWKAMQTCKLRFVGGIVLFFFGSCSCSQ